MPRVAWGCLLLLVLALPLASCFNDESPCPTCPKQNSGRISVVVRRLVLPSYPPDTLRLDSTQVRLDGGPTTTGRPGRTLTFVGLSRGRHEVKIVRWYTHNGLIESTGSTVLIELEEGELLIIDIHADFPRIAWSPPPSSSLARTRWAGGPAADQVG